MQTALTGEETWKQESDKLRRMYEELLEKLNHTEEKLKDANDQLKRYSHLIDQAVLIEASGANPLVDSDQRQREMEERIKKMMADEKNKSVLEKMTQEEEIKRLGEKYKILESEVRKS